MKKSELKTVIEKLQDLSDKDNGSDDYSQGKHDAYENAIHLLKETFGL